MNDRFAPEVVIRKPTGTAMSAFHPIVLQKSKLAAALIFGENLKREDIGDSYNLSRATEVAHEFSVGR